MPQTLQQALLDLGFEIYRANDESIVLAERVRMHLMESGVRVSLGATPRLLVCVRSQRSDHPDDNAEAMFDRVRAATSGAAGQRGFQESAAVARDIEHPTEAGTVLDVWHEVTFAKPLTQPLLAETIEDDLRWALGLPRCITR